MSIISNIAVSGINAASLRLRVAASNIANARSDGYVPKQVVQVDTGQGTAATVLPAKAIARKTIADNRICIVSAYWLANRAEARKRATTAPRSVPCGTVAISV